MNSVTCSFYQFCPVFESFKISFSLQNMFHIFCFWHPSNKVVGSNCQYVFPNIYHGENPFWSIHIMSFTFFCFLSLDNSLYTFIGYPGYSVTFSSSQFHHVLSFPIWNLIDTRIYITLGSFGKDMEYCAGRAIFVLFLQNVSFSTL